MFKELRFAIYSIKTNIQSSAELRTSFLLNIVGMVINNIAFILLWVFFIKSVGIIGGWTASDIVGLQGFTALSYGVIFSVATGIRKLPEYVTSGAFDKFMLSPKNLLSRVATSTFSPSAVGDILFGVICFAIYGILIRMSFYQVFLLAILVFFSTLIFLAMTITIYSSSFFFIDSSVVTNGFFELFFTPSLFHGGAFQGAMRFIFTFLVPSLLIGTLPVETIKNISLPQLAIVGLLSLAWFLISILVFYKAVKRYESSNFMTFGN